MLSNAAFPSSLEADASAYLREALGLAAEVQAWPAAAKLPYFLTDGFEVRALSLLGRQILLAIDRRTEKQGLAHVRGQMDKLHRLAGLPVVYVTGAMASYERRHLIEQKVPFLVPGNQLYLPDLGVDLREHFRRPPAAAGVALSPATQAMLIAVLLHQPWRGEWQPAEVMGELGYTAMTLSRAVKELVAADVATLRTEGRARWLHTEHSAHETWQHAKPLLRSPVKKRFWARPFKKWQPPHIKLASLSALARHSMLAEPPWPIFALSPAQWKAAVEAGIEALPAQLPGACEWEVWHYSPALVADSDTVDPLSLALSLQEHSDERVQLALDELEGQFPW